MNAVIPDLTEPILAARTWDDAHLTAEIPGLPRRTLLRSGVTWMGGGGGVFDWPTDAPFVARCTALPHMSNIYTEMRPGEPKEDQLLKWKRTHEQGTPAQGCSCGIYAVSDPYALEPYAYRRIFGVVRMWGRLIPAERGWRAEKAQLHAVIGWRVQNSRKHRATEGDRRKSNSRVEDVARWYGVPVLYEWPELTKPEEVVRWTSAESSR